MEGKAIYKKTIPYLVAVITFLIVAVGYFSPELLEGKVLNQHDTLQGYASGADRREHFETYGEKSLWGSRMFSGMPTYQIAPYYANGTVLTPLRDAFEFYLPSPASHLFACFLGFFLLLIALGVSPWLSIVGALTYGFSSYFVIIIQAGHIWKMLVLELLPATFAGIVWAYKGRYLLGGFITSLFFALQLYSNHIQMTYYFCIILLIYAIGRFIHDYRNRHLPRFFKASAVLLAAGAVALGCNVTNLYMSSKYSQETIRGKAELSPLPGATQSSGTDKDYATQWSYGIGETFSLLVPDVKGGATGAIGNDKTALENVDVRFRQDISQSNRYWGDQPFTSGPVYVGALIMFLFIIGCFLVKGYLKWVLLIATLLSIALSWGRNMMWLTDYFFDYFPLYDKFRAVSSILVIAEITIPLLAILGLSKLVAEPSLWKTRRKVIWGSAGSIVGLLLLFLITPDTFFNFISTEERQGYAAYAAKGPEISEQVNLFLFNLSEARESIFRDDVLRSLLFIVCGILLLQLYAMNKMRKGVLIVLLGVLIVVDMGGVDKRYLNGSHFVTKKVVANSLPMTEADKLILQDQDPDYRVYNLSVSPFNDASTSYYHKSVGGYHGAKLRRYQDLIERQIQSGNIGVLNMLNTKYFIVPDQKGGVDVQQNPGAMGHAWFVPNVKLVDNADQEMSALTGFDPAATAIVDKRFAGQLNQFQPGADSTASIILTDYKINHLTYKTNASKPQLAVFSEIYYDDGASSWQALIDGKPAEHFRTDYVLRGMVIPAGEHTVEFVFKPHVYEVCEHISEISLALLLLAGVALISFPFIRKKFRKS